MHKDRVHFLFLNLGHVLDHLLMLLFPTVVLTLEAEFGLPYQELLPLAVGGFVAFGVGALPAGWLADRWSRRGMMLVFFLGIGLSAVATGFANSPWSLAAGLTLIGLFAAIYHPVGIALVVEQSEGMGRRLGLNSLAGNLGVASASVTAGVLTDLIHWRAAYFFPGALAMVAALGYWAVARKMERPVILAGHASRSAFSGLSARRLFLILVLATLLGGLTFNTTLIALPKVFAIRLDQVATSATVVSALVSAVYLVGAMAQVLIGVLLDRVSLRRILMGLAMLQVPLFLLVSQLWQVALLVGSVFLMFAVFGMIPITDALVARSTADHIRSRVYAVKFLTGFGVSSVSAPLVALVFGYTGGFVPLFYLFSGCAFALVFTSLLLPDTVPGGVPGKMAQAGAD